MQNNGAMNNKPSGESEHRQQSAKFRIALFLGIFGLLGAIFTAIDLAPNLSHIDLTILSGPKSGQYHALVERLAADAAKRAGSVTNVATTGTAENLKRVEEAIGSEGALFALVPDGLQYPQAGKLELVARLPKTNTVFFLGLHANRIRYLADLKDMRVGIGPQGSGTALFAREILVKKELTGLNLTLSEHTFTDQVKKLENADLDIGVFLTSQDNPLINKAIHEGLQIASFENAEAWVVRVPGLRVETLYAGHYDHVALLPNRDNKVFRVDTLVLGDRDAPRSDVVGLLVLLNETYNGFIPHNRDTRNNTGLAQAKELRTFIDNDGPNVLDEYAPGLLDFMPPANLLHYVVVISVLMNLMTGWHRLRLYVVDSHRTEIENLMYKLFGTELTFEEIHELEVGRYKLTEEDRKLLDELISRSERLRQRCRKYAPSIVTPLGQENIYRYHEGLITQQLKILRDLRERVNAFFT